jgi:15-cis-phytoene desaturase
MKAIVIGGGLAGLTAATLLAKDGFEVHLFERSAQTGGRSFTVEKSNFIVNYGAHAVFGYDQSYLKYINELLDLNLELIPFSPEKVKYEINNELTNSPAHLKGIFTTELLSGMGRFDFIKALMHLFLADPNDIEQISFGEWMSLQDYREDVKRLIITLATSNFFTAEPEKLKASQVILFYQKLFNSSAPVSYLKNSWKQLIVKLEKRLLDYGGKIHFRSSLKQVIVIDKKVKEVVINEEKITGDVFIFAIPPELLIKTFDSNHQILLKRFTDLVPTKVTILDIGFEQSYEIEYPYLFDVDHKLLITSSSFYDKSIVPNKGQLLQAIAYLKASDYNNKESLNQRKEELEEFVEQYFPNWKENAKYKRYISEVNVQLIQHRIGQEPLPTFLEELDDVYFCGDWCQSKEQLSEISLDTAVSCTEKIIASYKVYA